MAVVDVVVFAGQVQLVGDAINGLSKDPGAQVLSLRNRMGDHEEEVEAGGGRLGVGGRPVFEYRVEDVPRLGKRVIPAVERVTLSSAQTCQVSV